MRYDAFISYNHAADGALAPALQDALQHLAKPWYRRRAMSVFRDETNLSASPELFDAIEAALNESRYYVLLASPGSAHSNWVGKEIGFWLATKTAATLRIVLVLTEGELKWDKAANCFDAERSTALHPALLHAFAAEPLHVDLREARAATTGGDAGHERNFRRLFRHPVAKIAARVRDVDPDSLEGEDLRQHRRTLQVAWGAAIALVALTVASVFGLVSARNNASEARRQTKSAQAGELAARARSLLADDAPLGLAVAVAAQKHASSSLARDALSAASAEPITGVFGPVTGAVTSDVHPVAVSPDGRYVATTDGLVERHVEDHPVSRVAVWDVQQQHRHPQVLTQRGTIGITSLSFSPDGRKLAVSYERPTRLVGDSLFTPGVNVLWDLDHGTRVVRWRQKYTHVDSLAFAPDGVTVAAGGEHGQFEVWDTAANTQRALPASSGLAPSVRQVAVSPDGRRYAATDGGVADSGSGAIAVGEDLGNVVLWDSVTGAIDKTLPVDGWDVFAGGFSPDGNLFVTGDQLGRVEVWNVAGGALVSKWNDESPVSFVAFDPSGSVVISGDDNGTVIARDARTGEVGATWNDGAAVTSVVFSSKGHTVVTGDEQGRAVLRDTRLLFTGTKFAQPVLRLAFADDGSTLVALTVPLEVNQSSAVVRWTASEDALPAAGDDEKTNIMAVSPDGRLLVTVKGRPSGSGSASEVVVANARDGSTLHRWTVDGLVSEIAMSSNGRRVVTSETSFSGDTGGLTVRETTTGKVVRTVPKAVFFGPLSMTRPGPQTAVDAHGDVMATVVARHLSVARPNSSRLQRLDHASGQDDDSTVVTSADGRTLALIHISSDRATHVEVVRRWTTATPHTSTVPGSSLRAIVAALSPDGRYLAIGDTDRAVQVWELGRGGAPVDPPRLVTTWTTSSAVTSLAFSPDGARVAAGDASGHVEYWDLTARVAPAKQLVSRICHMLRGYRPASAEWKRVVPYLDYADLCKK